MASTVTSQFTFNNTSHLHRPQSFKVVSQAAVPLQCIQLKQPTTLFESTCPIVLSSSNKDHNQDNSNKLQQNGTLISKSCYQNAANSCKKRNLSKQHPQTWCGKGNTEPTATKHVYNYAQKKETNEKTPMCQIAELARYNKLKHEYVLLDESGPAHKKKFTVKLILCEGNEFEGSGPSIKKAQQSAAKCALESTDLPKPSQIRSIRKSNKKDESGNLLTLVASQLGINVHCREELIRQPSNTLISNKAIQILPNKAPYQSALATLPIMPSNCFSQSTLFTQPNQSSSSRNGMVSILDCTLTANQCINPNMTMPLMPPFSPVSIFNNALLQRFSTFPSTIYLDGLNLNTNVDNVSGQHLMQNVNYKVTITLSLDNSQHIGIGSNFSIAKQTATLKALAHLKPELEKFKQNKNLTNGEKVYNEESCGLLTDDHGNQLFSDDGLNTISDQTSINGESPDFKNEVENLDLNKHNVSMLLSHDLPCENGNRLSRRKKAKSVVSQIHEYALRLRMNVEFEVLAETGEPHSRQYILRCRLTAPIIPDTDSNKCNLREYIAEGQGPSKKAAKQVACQKLLDQVHRLLDDDPIQLAAQIVRQVSNTDNNKHGIGKNSKELQSKRRTIIKDKKMDPEYGHHINPVSRLIQIMQARQEKEPQFHLISEHGLNRHKEFTVSVQCMDLHETGIGPNKKLAKRAAAEAMLARIGYVKPMPQPGKSLLKRKTDQKEINFMDIGHFDVNMFIENNNNQNDHLSITTDGLQKQHPHEQQSKFDDTLTFANVEFALNEEITDNVKPIKEVTLTDADHHEHESLSDEKCKTNYHLTNSSINANTDDTNFSAIGSQRRRVTFSEHVSACPPPEDFNYPASSIAPLKLDLGMRMKRRSRDSQRVLTLDEIKKLSKMAKLFLCWQDATKEKKGLVNLQADDWNWKEVDGIQQLGADIDAFKLTEKNIKTQKAVLPESEQRLMNQQKQQNIIGNSKAILSSPPATFLNRPLHSFPLIFPFVTPIVQPKPTKFSISPLPLPSLLVNTTSFAQVPMLTPTNETSASTISNPSRLNYHLKHEYNFALIGAKEFVEHVAKQFKFTVAYSDFPKTKNETGDEQCFSLLTLGLAKPIVCHGSGPTEIHAHNDAAYNAIRSSLSQMC